MGKLGCSKYFFKSKGENNSAVKAGEYASVFHILSPKKKVTQKKNAVFKGFSLEYFHYLNNI